MQRARIVSFDMDGTITDRSFADSVWLEGIPCQYAVENNLSFKTAKRKVISEYGKVGKEVLEWYDLSYWIERLSLDISPKEILSSFQHRIKLFPEVPAVLQKLRDEALRLIIVTNARREFADFELKTTNIIGYFEHVFSTTSDFGLVKNTVTAYRKVCDLCNVSPEEVIHVGDDESFDFYVPKKLGITAFYLDRICEHSGPFTVCSLKDLSKKLLDVPNRRAIR